jgi:hypothetical protein
VGFVRYKMSWMDLINNGRVFSLAFFYTELFAVAGVG